MKELILQMYKQYAPDVRISDEQLEQMNKYYTGNNLQFIDDFNNKVLAERDQSVDVGQAYFLSNAYAEASLGVDLEAQALQRKKMKEFEQLSEEKKQLARQEQINQFLEEGNLIELLPDDLFSGSAPLINDLHVIKSMFEDFGFQVEKEATRSGVVDHPEGYKMETYKPTIRIVAPNGKIYKSDYKMRGFIDIPEGGLKKKDAIEGEFYQNTKTGQGYQYKDGKYVKVKGLNEDLKSFLFNNLPGKESDEYIKGITKLKSKLEKGYNYENEIKPTFLELQGIKENANLLDFDPDITDPRILNDPLLLDYSEEYGMPSKQDITGRFGLTETLTNEGKFYQNKAKLWLQRNDPDKYDRTDTEKINKLARRMYEEEQLADIRFKKSKEYFI